MGLVDTLIGSLGANLAGRAIVPQGNAPAPGFRSYVSVVDGDALYDTVAEVLALITGTAHASYLKIWEKTIVAQTTYRWGYGSAALQANQGFMWFASLDVAADFDIGVLRLVESKARETNTWTVAEIPDASLHTTTVTTLITATPTDRNTMIPLPEKTEYPQVGVDSKLQLLYSLTTAATAHDAVGFQIPVTIRQ